MSDRDEITVIGAGLLGLASAWALREQGHAVRVIEAREQVALETSFANAGMITPSMADPWNSPGIWRFLIGSLVRGQGPILVRPTALPSYLSWGLRFLRHSETHRHARSTRANFALAALSLSEFQRLRAVTPFRFALRTAGTLQVFRDTKALEEARQHAASLVGHGLRADVLDATALREREPTLRDTSAALVGGIHYPDDETGDAHRYCLALAAHLGAHQVPIELGVRVRGLRAERGRLCAVDTDAGERAVSRVVLATATATPALLAPLGLRLPVRPVKGYSLTVPVPSDVELPARSLIDHHLHGAITPLDRHLRLAGTAELSGFDRRLRSDRLDALWALLADLLPRQHARLDRAAAQPWCGFRPMSADGLPYIGATPISGLYINTGHGHLGWTQSMGSGRLLAELLGNRAPAIDPAPYRFQRD